MNIGYACLSLAVANTEFKSLRLKNLNEKNLKYIIKHNLDSLNNIIDYNIRNKIKLFRISSDIIPLASHESMYYPWQEEFKEEFRILGKKISENNLRVSMHPGQYTVLNSPNPKVVKKSIEDLRYHTDFLNALNRDSTSKIILHVGGVYKDKEGSIERFIRNYKLLDKDIKARLVIENDDKSYTFEDIVAINKKIAIPLVYDNLHNSINPGSNKSDRENILRASRSWKKEDGRQKIHYSQQDRNKRVGSHSPTIDLKEFDNFYNQVKDLDIDIMLEVKDKNLSTIKVNNFIYGSDIRVLEKEWSRYKYSVLESDPNSYNKIRELLKDKDSYPIINFYNLIDQSLVRPNNLGYTINALEHVWGYFKNTANEKERKKFYSYLNLYKAGRYSIRPIKKLLYSLAKKYNSNYLLDSYFFWI